MPAAGPKADALEDDARQFLGVSLAADPCVAEDLVVNDCEPSVFYQGLFTRQKLGIWALAPRGAKNPRKAGFSISGGEGGIRTHGAENRTLDFESSPFDHSGTSPCWVAGAEW